MSRKRALAEVAVLDEDGDRKPTKEEQESKKLLQVLKTQRERSVGFDYNSTINQERADALDYYKGKHEGAVARDLPTAANRSTVVSTDVANDVETSLPDIVDVFTASDDAITFNPQNEDDVEAAKQETDYVRHILFVQNRGRWIFYEVFKDALISKTGIFHFYWDGEPEYDEYQTTATEPQIEEIEELGNELLDIEETGTITKDGFPVFHCTYRKQCADGHVVIESVAPEDFTISPETVIPLADSNYCAMKKLVSRQSLLDKGYDEKKVRQLRRADEDDEPEKQARDTVSERNNSTEAGADMLEMVEITIHYIRMDLEDKKSPQVWRVVTGNEESVELEREKRARIEFAAITPYPMPHRFIGQSLADKTMPIQKWKTAVIRAANDHLYFANNQRQEVKRSGIVPGVTMPQLTENTPGSPVVTEDGNSLRAIQNGTPAMDLVGYIEFINSEKEVRTGVTRQSLGIPSDVMHQTKGGNESLMNASQKRARMMAWLFAETGVRDLYIGVHDLARSNATIEDTIQLRGKWVPIAPSEWKRRKDATIDIGVGSGGKEQDLMGMREYRGFLTELIEGQGGLDSPKAIVTRDNAFKFAQRYGDKLGVKGSDTFISDPAEVEAEKKANGEEEGPPPEVQKAMMEIEVKKQTAAATLELKKMEAQQDAEIELMKMKEKAKLDREQAALDAQLAVQKAQAEIELAKIKAAAELELAKAKAAAEIEMERERAAVELQMERERMSSEEGQAERNSQRETAVALDKNTKDSGAKVEISKNRAGGSLAE